MTNPRVPIHVQVITSQNAHDASALPQPLDFNCFMQLSTIRV